MNPVISVVICSYNRATYLPKSINSVLSQSFKDFEIIIVDDASTDNTSEVVAEVGKKDARVKYFKNEQNLGISKSRNRGVSLSSGKYIAMLDSDDYWIDDDKLQKQFDIISKDKKIALVGTGIVLVNENGEELKKDIFNTDDESIRHKILSKNQFAQSSVLFRKSVFNECGGYDESLIVCEDLDLWLRFGQKYNFANLSEPMTAYLMHPSGISKQNKKKIAVATDRIIEKYKSFYPNYFKAKIKSYLRILLNL